MLALALALGGALGQAPAAVAQDRGDQGYAGVANLSAAAGDVVIVRGDGGEQVAASVNAPLLPGDYVTTGDDSLAEVQFDGISMLRLAADTQVRLVDLDPSAREMLLAGGTVDLAELQGQDGNPQIDTPPLSIRPNQSGDYRVSVSGDGETLVTVRSGSATVTDGAGSHVLGPGSTLAASGAYANPSIEMQGPVAYDAFDEFIQSRDRAMLAAYDASPYLSPQLAGYSNFSGYGQWHDVPGYGYAWAPYAQAESGFAPYQNGQWVAEPGYGYVWVPNEPWGYAPAHYGSWFYNAAYGGWLWQPPAYQQQVSPAAVVLAWLPALVAFFVIGNNANIGWIPLAPGEPYHPWFSYGRPGYSLSAPYPPTTVTNITNVTNVTNITNVTNVYNYYGNARYRGGATMIPISAWQQGNFKQRVTVQAQQLRGAALVSGAIPVVPTTANLGFSQRVAPKHVVVLSRAFSETPRFAATAPTLLPFAEQQAQYKKVVDVKPKVVPLPPPAAVVRPVYHPVPHPPVHLTTTVRASAAPAVAPNSELQRTVTPKPPFRPFETPKPLIEQVVTPRPFVAPVVTPRPVVAPVVTPKPAFRPVETPKPVIVPVVTPKPVIEPVVTPRPLIAPVFTPRPANQPVVTPRPVQAGPPKPAAHAPKPRRTASPPPR